MKRFVLAISMLAAFAPEASQAQIVKAGAAREANFLYEVKVIDEFIERFNDEPTSFLRKEYIRLGKDINFTRRDLIKYLFEKPVAGSDVLVTKFIDQVTDSARPQLLSFNDTGWYAEVSCTFLMNGRKAEIPLIMQIVPDTDRSTRWMITGIGDATVFQNAPAPAGTEAKARNHKKFIPPSDYATNFLEFHHIMAAGADVSDYLTPELLASERGKKFVQLLQSKKLVFEAPGYMRFYFFQIPNYTFIVERFVRQTMHSGWLISGLTATTDDEKHARKQKLLQRSL